MRLPASSITVSAREAALLVPVHIAGDGRHRRELLELLVDGPTADIAGVQDVIYALEMAQDRPVEPPVRVGNHADAKDLSWHGLAPRVTGMNARQE